MNLHFSITSYNGGIVPTTTETNIKSTLKFRTLKDVEENIIARANDRIRQENRYDEVNVSKITPKQWQITFYDKQTREWVEIGYTVNK